jgi:hypothetical protein
MGHFSSDGGEYPAHKPIMSSPDVAGLDIDPSELKLPHFSPDEFVGKFFVLKRESLKSLYVLNTIPPT